MIWAKKSEEETTSPEVQKLSFNLLRFFFLSRLHPFSLSCCSMWNRFAAATGDGRERVKITRRSTTTRQRRRRCVNLESEEQQQHEEKEKPKIQLNNNSFFFFFLFFEGGVLDCGEVPAIIRLSRRNWSWTGIGVGIPSIYSSKAVEFNQEAENVPGASETPVSYGEFSWLWDVLFVNVLRHVFGGRL